MTNEELNIETAKARGIKDIAVRVIASGTGLDTMALCSGVVGQGGFVIQDYCDDLNAMHQIEADAGFDLSNTLYAKVLAWVVLGLDLWDNDEITLNWWSLQRIARATARQRAVTWLNTHQIQEAQRRAVRETNLLRN